MVVKLDERVAFLARCLEGLYQGMWERYPGMKQEEMERMLREMVNDPANEMKGRVKG